MKTTKILILLGILGLSSYAYACQIVVISVPDGFVQCITCGNIIQCQPI